MKKAILILWCALLLSVPSFAVAHARAEQAASTASSQSTSKAVAAKVEETQAIKTKIEEAQAQQAAGTRFVRSLTNVQIELTLTDQLGSATPQKKTVSMIVASGNWGKIRNTAARIGPMQTGLNVDARPLVSVDGPVQLELTIYYYPPQGDSKESGMPTELNQSLTVVLQSGKPLMISQAADPASDRKINVEVKATILK
jgi:hypothetical protein